MGGYILVSILVSIIALVVNIYFCLHFANRAYEKGHSNVKYFWICIFFGVLGYVWVAALPDEVMERRIANLEKQISHSQKVMEQKIANLEKQISHPQNVNATHSSNGWTCTCGLSHASYVSTCTCGVNKRDIL